MNPIKYLNGIGNLGLVASGKRKIKSGMEYNKYFSPPKRQDKYLTYAGTTNDTIGYMADIIKSTLDDTKGIAPVLVGKNLQATLNNIFHFVFAHIQYKPDDPANEELRRPVRAWADRTSGVDCDCYSIFIGSILSNLNIPFALRMVKINGKPYFQHVYVVVPKDGRKASLSSNYYTVDPVLDTFNEEHPFTGKHDLFMQPIKYLNGTPSLSLNGLNGSAIADNLYYSEEAAQVPNNNVVFFDGIDFYERANFEGLNGLNGLQGLNGLGFLSKIWKGIKVAGKVIKKIGKKAVKKIVHKKDGTKRGVFKLFSKKNQNAGQASSLQPMQSKGLTPVNVSAPAQLTPIGTSSGASSVTPQTMIDIAKNMDKSMGIDQILNVVKAAAPDNKLVNQLIDAKSKANAGISNFEARLMAQDAQKVAESNAKATASEQKAELLQTMYNMNQNQNNAGFGGNIDMKTMLMIGLAVGLTLTVSKMNNHSKAA